MRAGRFAGVLLVLIGVTVNPWTLEAFVVPDGLITAASSRWLITAVELVVVAAGVWLCLTPRRTRRPSTAEILMLLLSTTLSLALAEVTLRVWHVIIVTPAPPPAGRTNHPPVNFEPAQPTGWRMIPSRQFQWTVESTTSTYTSNPQGFRSPHDFSAPASPRIGLAGDSFTWGLGVDYDETFGALVERRLAGGHVENFGMPGFGIDQMWQSVRAQVLPRAPSLVIVAFIDDDFTRSLTPFREEEGMAKPRFEVDHGRIRLQTQADRSGAMQWLWRHSEFVKLARAATIRLRPFGEWWALNTAMLDAIAADGSAQGVGVLFVRLPQVDGGPFPSLAQHMRQRGFEYIDLGPDGSTHDLHYKEDRHMDRRGHAHVAAAVLTWMTARRPDLLRARAAPPTAR